MTAAAKDKEGNPAKFVAELTFRVHTVDKDTIVAGLKDESVGIGKYIKEEEGLDMIDGLVPANGVQYEETLVLNIEGPKIMPALRKRNVPKRQNHAGVVEKLPTITSAAIVEGLARAWLFPQGDDPNTGGLGIAERKGAWDGNERGLGYRGLGWERKWTWLTGEWRWELTGFPENAENLMAKIYDTWKELAETSKRIREQTEKIAAEDKSKANEQTRLLPMQQEVLT